MIYEIMTNGNSSITMTNPETKETVKLKGMTTYYFNEKDPIAKKIASYPKETKDKYFRKIDLTNLMPIDKNWENMSSEELSKKVNSIYFEAKTSPNTSKEKLQEYIRKAIKDGIVIERVSYSNNSDIESVQKENEALKSTVANQSEALKQTLLKMDEMQKQMLAIKKQVDKDKK